MDYYGYNPAIHHRRSIRLKEYDYSWPGLYFITMCTQDNACLFGAIKNNKVYLNQFGKIVKGEWLKSEKIRKEIVLDEFVIMPNHLHGIVEIIEMSEANGTVGANGRSPEQTIAGRSPEQNGTVAERRLKNFVIKI